MAGALAGIRVLDVTNFFAGPHCAMLLGDLGAEVIKLEHPPHGDPMRFREDDSGYAPSFVAKNRNKQSLMLDLTRPEGRAALDRLLPTIDVLIISIRPRSRAKLGLDYGHVSAVNPRLVYCSVSGFGETEAARDRSVFDTSALARSGLLSLITGEFDQPMRIQALLSDMLAGTYACYGVMGALVARTRTGRGQEVKTSLLASSIAFSDSAFLHAFVAQRLGQTRGRLKYRTAGFLFLARDGLPFAVHVAPSPVKNWGNFAQAMERPELQEDPRFSSKRGREENYPALHAEMSAQAKLKPRAYWLERLEAHDVPASPIHALADVFSDPIVAALGMLHEVPDPWGTKWKLVGSALDLSDTPVLPPARAPLMGEHSRAILSSVGYAAAELDALERDGVILGPPGPGSGERA